MMRSLYSGVTGLKSHQTKMDVIGNNIANVNTTAYKAASMTFTDLLSQTTQSASGANASTGTGGTNARQIGLGVKAGAISNAIASQGSAQSTGNALDIMITGDNFFVVSNGSTNFFTRDGSFYVDGVGNLCMSSTGYNVMGWLPDPEDVSKIKVEDVHALKIMDDANRVNDPQATSLAYVAGIIDKNDNDVTTTSGKTINLNFYDSLGYSYTAKLAFKQGEETNTYAVELDSIIDATGKLVDLSGVSFGGSREQSIKSSIAFDSAYKWDGDELKKDGVVVFPDSGAELNGLEELAAAYNYGGDVEGFLNLLVEVDPDTHETKSIAEILNDTPGVTAQDYMDAADAITSAHGGRLTAVIGEDGFEAAGRKFSGYEISFDKGNGSINPGTTKAVIDFKALDPNKYPNFENIEIDLSKISMFDNHGTSTISATSGDADGNGAGYALGNMTGISVQTNGMIYGTYDNGQTKLLGQIATASFPNAAGLEKAGDNVYKASLNSGEFDGIGTDITSNGGYMTTGYLEMSNVDLAAQFTEMITTQRGFQANSRIITVSDTLLEELTNLKR